MTKRIQQLDTQTIAAIAAGEVVENPASVVKELCENALDAGADVIRVEISGGGIRRLRISDNGHGMGQDDALHAFDQHATSKIIQIEDLDTIGTMGFRGEALASISAVARVTLETREPGESMGTRVVIHGGELLEHVPTGCREGTTITVEDLFFNVPARYKFLMKDQTEGNRVSDLLRQLALARPDVSFHLTADRKEMLHSPGNDDLLSVVHALFGSDLVSGLIPVMTDEQSIVKVSGLVSKPDSVRKSRTWQMFFVNKRLVRDGTVLRALEDAYQTLLMKGRFPAAILFLELPSHLVDVNVHPQKTQLRFWKKDELYRAVYHQVKNTLYSALGAVTPLEEKEATSKDLDGPEQAQPFSKIRPEASQSSWVQPTATESALDFAERPLQEFEQQRFTRDQLISRGQQPDVRRFEPKKQAEDGLSLAPSEEISEDVQVTTRDVDVKISPKMQQLLDARLIGQIFNTYLLFEDSDALLLLDQHAAHEKILYEQKVRSWEEQQEVPGQLLLNPLTIRLAPDELTALEEAESLLQQIGYDWSLFGPTEILLRAAPQGTYPELAAADFRDSLAFYRTREPELSQRKDDAILHLLATSSCKAAVKAHDPLTKEEIEALLTQMATLDNPWHCPHGRPVVVKLTQTELERFFQRIAN